MSKQGFSSMALSHKILIIEDNELNMKLFNDVLKAHGFKTIRAMTGSEAFDIIERESPNLILLDIQLPGISGFEVARRIKSHEASKNIPIIAVTAFAMRGDEDKILDSGCNAYLPKPISINSLINTITQYIGGKLIPPTAVKVAC